jgi:hypothetical protein
MPALTAAITGKSGAEQQFRLRDGALSHAAGGTSYGAYSEDAPDHSPIGDGTLVEQERSFLTELRDRALALKRQGESAEQAGQDHGRIQNEVCRLEHQ